MNNTRQNKVSRQIQKDISDIFQKEMNALAHGSMLSVTVVRVSPDLENARVYISVFPSEKSAEVIHAVQESAKTIRHLLAQRIKNQVRKIPELIFQIDDSLDYVEKIEKLLAPKTIDN